VTIRRRVLLVVNPAARRADRLRERAAAAFRAAGVVCDVVLTQEPGEGGRAAAERHGEYDAVFTLGGDGTAMEVVGALAGSGRPVGVLPGGTGNLIARTLGVPLDVRAAVPALLRGAEARIDLGRLASGQRFAFAAGVGVDARMIEETQPALKRRLGVLAYALTASRAVLRRETFVARVVVDGDAYEREAAAVMVANFGAVLNQLIWLGPGIREDDGMLDLCVFSPGTLRDALRIMWRLVRKDFGDDPCLLYRPGRHFVVDTDPPRQAQADGELLGPTPFEVTVEPRAATLLVPTS
jgi:YegS/Rv2252/BmrU family lipid kinase